jgi:hypothetical protein
MASLLVVAIIIGIIAYKIIKSNSNKIRISVSLTRPNIDWENQRKEKAKLKQAHIRSIKNDLKKPDTLESALLGIENAVKRFISNFGSNFIDIQDYYNKLIVPEDLEKKELYVRKEFESEYKQRAIDEHKLKSIYLAYQHLKLLLENPQYSWSNFKGLSCLYANLRAEEYFSDLAGILLYVKDLYPDNQAIKDIDIQLEKLFKLWASRVDASKMYRDNCKTLTNTTNVSDKHFLLNPIIDYLSRRYKYNPSFRDELVNRCIEDIATYERFLMEFHSMHFVGYDNEGNYIEAKHTFEDVKELPGYIVPGLISFDVLYEIYEKEHNIKGLKWLGDIGKHIKYRDYVQENTELLKSNNKESNLANKTNTFEEITSIIEIPKSGEKKLSYVSSKGKHCSTEDAFKDYFEQEGYKVMRAEVGFWQGMFCLSFWEEIFGGMGNPNPMQDIPFDLFRGASFYDCRKSDIDNKYAYLRTTNLSTFINKQIDSYGKYKTRLLYNVDYENPRMSKNCINVFSTEIVQSFIKRVDINIFAKIVYRIAMNPSENRAGLPDYVIWDDTLLEMVEVKQLRERIRDTQVNWLNWMLENNIPVRIVRVKGI